MRILSQDGMIFNDIPYEEFVLGIARDRDTDMFCIVVRRECTVSESGFPLNGVMAKYSTESKAKRAMEMLREAYIVHFQYKTMTAEQKAFFINCTDEKEREKIYGVFCFPSDDEAEV